MNQTGPTKSRMHVCERRIPGRTQLLSKRPEMVLPDHWPAIYSRAKGMHVWDLNWAGRHAHMSYTGIGACVLGYADAEVKAAVKRRSRGSRDRSMRPRRWSSPSCCASCTRGRTWCATRVAAARRWPSRCASPGRARAATRRVLRLPRLARLVPGGEPRRGARRSTATCAGAGAGGRAARPRRDGAPVPLQPTGGVATPSWRNRGGELAAVVMEPIATPTRAGLPRGVRDAVRPAAARSWSSTRSPPACA